VSHTYTGFWRDLKTDHHKAEKPPGVEHIEQTRLRQQTEAKVSFAELPPARDKKDSRQQPKRAKRTHGLTPLRIGRWRMAVGKQHGKPEQKQVQKQIDQQLGGRKMWRRRTCGALCRGRRHICLLSLQMPDHCEKRHALFFSTQRNLLHMNKLRRADRGRYELGPSSDFVIERWHLQLCVVYCQKRLTLVRTQYSCEIGHSDKEHHAVQLGAQANQSCIKARPN
jgi:hypothetical protein